MRITRLRFRIAEMLIAPPIVLLCDGLMHLTEGKPFMSEYLWGGVFAIFLVRGLDVLRAARKQWPENGD